MRSFNRDGIEGTNSFKNVCLMCVRVRFVLCLYSDWFCGLT